ncbi:hypothetical protein BGW36DRAFT_296761 [Talaromyces proteolyticus]|uniref:DUF924 domain-containing protein n=1 Tax=Talaromyces proteolyticus TaxID=1131652 RepID=A0AAD4KSS2_9EURO|nr:uncharacterized protein BGW36DRAFT_296761 [Talaromyces proteolyticus]KAH8696210.1 hypothetical protein BGW36DRAFT_296761 [Talaromyces proteolyticus]
MPPTSSNNDLKSLLTPVCSQNVVDFWFGHFANGEEMIMPSQKAYTRWFSRDPEFDRACVEQFHPTLEGIRQRNLSADELLELTNPASSLDWLGVILLLDQITRNCYRGSESAVVFNVFDPLAREIALRAISRRDVVESPEIKFYLARRMWFGLPLMHSEDLKTHQAALRYFESMSQEVEDLINDIGESITLAEDGKKARAIFQQQPEAARQLLANQVSFEKKHLVIIEKFGRYPHRNAALGREPTAAEIEYLENGGEVFG